MSVTPKQKELYELTKLIEFIQKLEAGDYDESDAKIKVKTDAVKAKLKIKTKAK